MSLIEVMISLAISASLLVAVGAAWTATGAAVEANDEFLRASRGARIGVNQIMAEVRRCKSGATDGRSLEIVTADDERRIYAYDSAGARLTMMLPDQVPGESYTLARNVTAAQFQTDGHSISLVVTVQSGKHRITLSGAAMPRRTITFN
jgi:hypothetical protein